MYCRRTNEDIWDQGSKNHSRLNFLQWQLIYVGPQYGTCFVSPAFWRLECLGGFYISGKIVHLCLGWREQRGPNLESAHYCIWRARILDPKHCNASPQKQRKFHCTFCKFVIKCTYSRISLYKLKSLWITYTTKCVTNIQFVAIKKRYISRNWASSSCMLFISWFSAYNTLKTEKALSSKIFVKHLRVYLVS
jgi:hypothetical protein